MTYICFIIIGKTEKKLSDSQKKNPPAWRRLLPGGILPAGANNEPAGPIQAARTEGGSGTCTDTLTEYPGVPSKPSQERSVKNPAIAGKYPASVQGSVEVIARNSLMDQPLK